MSNSIWSVDCEILFLFLFQCLVFSLCGWCSDRKRTSCLCIFSPRPPQSSTTGNSLHNGVTTRSSSSTSRWSRRARPSPQQSSASTRSVWAAPSATTRSCSESTKWSRSVQTGKKSKQKNKPTRLQHGRLITRVVQLFLLCFCEVCLQSKYLT